MLYLLLFSALASFLLIRPLGTLLSNQQSLMQPNFEKQVIPTSYGVLFLIVVLLSTGLMGLLNLFRPKLIMLLIFLVVGMGFLGFLDDIVGKRELKGVRNRWRLLIAKGISDTGTLRLVAGCFLALSAGFMIGTTFWEGLLYGATLALATNFVNLLDTGPGRAVKGYFLALLLIMLLASRPNDVLIVMPAMVAAAVYLPIDLQKQAMMGNAGSHALGASLGLAGLLGLKPLGVLTWFMLLLAFQIFCDRYSLNDLIKRLPLLRFIDELGRK